MTSIEMAEQALADSAKATPGSWRNTSGKGTGCVSCADCAIYINIRTVEVDECVQRWQADAALIANARTREPLLARAVIELHAEVVALNAEIGRHRVDLIVECANHSNTRDELEAMTAARTTACDVATDAIDALVDEGHRKHDDKYWAGWRDAIAALRRIGEKT